MEDRWTAIRWAIGSAQTDDCVVIAGRGHKDFVEWGIDGENLRVRPVPHLLYTQLSNHHLLQEISLFNLHGFVPSHNMYIQRISFYAGLV